MLKRYLALISVPAMNTFAPLIVLPAIASNSGAAGFAAIAAGQSLGAAGSVLVDFAWASNGPSLVHNTPSQDRRPLYVTSLKQRGCALVPVLAVGSFFAGTLSELHPYAAIASMASAAAMGMSPAWFYVAERRTAWLVLGEALPRLIASVVGAALLLLDSPLIVLPLLQILVSLIVILPPACFYRRFLQKDLHQTTRHDAWRPPRARDQVPSLLGRLTSTLYVNLPVAIVSSFATPALAATYAASDRLQKAVLGGMQPVSQVMQGSSPKDDPRQEARRLRRLLGAAVALGATASTFCAVGGPELLGLLFREEIIVDTQVTIALAASVGLIVVTRCSGLIILLPRNRHWTVTNSILLGGICAGVGYAFASTQRSIDLMAVTVLVAELVVLLYQLAVIMRQGILRTPL